jgi:hypothetical protein
MVDQHKPEPTHYDISRQLGRVEGKLDILIGVEERTRSLEISRARGRGMAAGFMAALTFIGAKLTEII